MTKIHELADLGQAVWFDYIRRSFTDSGKLQALVNQGVRGVTSNPSIFEKAIAGSDDYDEALAALVAAGKTVDEIYEALAMDDIRSATEVLRPVYDATGGLDGYVSLEISPTLADDTQATIADARRLFAALDRPNVLIKVPATPAGVPAIETLIGDGINVNVTLIFSLAQYEAVAEAYIAGLEKLAVAGGDVSMVASVASFFISRVDAAVDKALDADGETELQGAIAVANAKVAYARFGEIFSGPRWEKLAARGARVQRPLWASTSTKNPTYPDTLYVDGLIGPDTVNTVPPATLDAFLDHGHIAVTVDADVDVARVQLARLAELGIDLDAITQQLLDDGVAKFAQAFEQLMASIAGKREKLLAILPLTANLGTYQTIVDTALDEIQHQQVMARIWDGDHTVWEPEPTEITNRLGWLRIAEAMQDNIPQMKALANAVRADGYTHALLLGMGGSSLAPEVFRRTFGIKTGYLDLAVLDSTDPGAVLAYEKALDLSKTLFIVATKSGGTTETLSFFKYFYNQVVAEIGSGAAGAHFVAITDPSSKLVDIAQAYGFRKTFLNDPNIGGRYSALSYFGLVPATLVGVDVETLLQRALATAHRPNAGAGLGAIMGALAKAGRDKITFITSPALASFGDWVEQLIAESTGKEGKGILPVVGEPVGAPDVYGDDRLFVDLRLAGDTTQVTEVSALEAAGHPVVRVNLDDIYDLGAQFFLWEMATAVAGSLLCINPFNQPNVESAKVIAREMVAAYQKAGSLPTSDTARLSREAVHPFLMQAQPGDYVALQAYVQPTPETDAALAKLRLHIRDTLKVATTVGYGPRFLHSTEQLHKGDRGNGLFIQFTSDAAQDAMIPDKAGKSESSISFGVLELAQALGDQQALLDANRRVIRFHLGKDAVRTLQKFIEDRVSVDH